ncbi:MAG: glycoside hydrolase family 125 protein [Blautia producta]
MESLCIKSFLTIPNLFSKKSDVKFELDSLCYPIQLAYLLWKNTGCINQFDEIFQSGVQIILDLFQREQDHEEYSPYRFTRQNTYPTETLSRNGNGSLTKPLPSQALD